MKFPPPEKDMAELERRNRLLRDRLRVSEELLSTTEEIVLAQNEDLERRVAERTRELTIANEELRLHERQLQLLLSLNKMHDKEEREIIDFMLDHCAKITDSPICFLGLLNEDESFLTSCGFSKDVMKECGVVNQPLHFKLSEAGIWAEAIRRRTPFVCNDYSRRHAAKKGYPRGHVPLKRILSVPVFEGGRIVALGCVANKDVDYTRGDIKMFGLMLNDMWHLLQRRRTTRELVAAKEEAVRANAAKSQFLANMSHEIRTPMNGVIGLTELVLGAALSAEQRAYLNMVKDSAHSLMNIINDLLDFSKIEAGKMKLEDTPFSLRDILERVVGPFALPAAQKGLELVLHISPDVPGALRGDPTRLRQIVNNLIGNALKFTEKGEVVLLVENVGRTKGRARLRFSVMDTGMGITPAQQKMIFEPFLQADGTSTRKYGGSGLGLAICARLTEMMGGEISLASAPGEGSAFRVMLPFGTRREKAAAMDAERAMVRGLSVLVADDNASSRRALEDLLKGWCMRPVMADRGARALSLIRERCKEKAPFPLVLLDGGMSPDLAGEIKALPRCKHTRVLLMLIPGQEVACVPRGKNAPDACLIKPVRQRELLRAMAGALRASGLRDKGRGARDNVSSRSGRGLRVLLAEDNPVNQVLATEVLKRMGHTVTLAANGLEALRMVGKRAFDLVLMDLQMPQMDGLAAVSRIRRRERGAAAHLPIIALTAMALDEDRRRCLEAGMDGYLAKPIDWRELRKAIKSLGL